jgi:hypothetical protein
MWGGTGLNRSKTLLQSNVIDKMKVVLRTNLVIYEYAEIHYLDDGYRSYFYLTWVERWDTFTDSIIRK